jgi:dihydroorotate dehydrogenase
MYNCIKLLVFKTDPELAHKLAIKTIKYNFLIDRSVKPEWKPVLSQKYFDLDFNSPVGLAAGFDKNGETTHSIHMNGFGFAEIGTVTPKPQSGNPKPRLFRLIEDESLINRLGFNNNGIRATIDHIKSQSHKIPIGINIGPNKNSDNFINDYLQMLDLIYQNPSLFNYITINISSPNTPGLRDINLKDLLEQIESRLNTKTTKIPFFVKISPDMKENDLTDALQAILNSNVNGIIVSNTTIDRENIISKNHVEQGGLSGKKLFDKSTSLLSEVYKITQKKVLLIGVGGISNAHDVITKIRHGASLVQLYTGMIYHGLFLADKINNDLVQILKKDGVKNISELIGISS